MCISGADVDNDNSELELAALAIAEAMGYTGLGEFLLKKGLVQCKLCVWRFIVKWSVSVCI